ncbi:MAG TPA: hypothetical protein VMR79_08735, partial [Verrucomicrobiae bacterium]|nr:hypothetical protein [Verrucomicrobiae bacterium]
MGLGATTAPGPARATTCGAFVAAWGGPVGGQFSTPYAAAVDATGSTLVADTGNHRIQRFDASGNFVTA